MNLKLIILLLILHSTLAHAQKPATLPPYRHYTLRDGLSQMQVMCLFQDSRGCIWVGTKGGLNCFNGEKFTTYTSKNYPVIENDHIESIKEDSQGRIWGSTSKGLIRIDGSTVKYFPVNTGITPSITCDDKGHLWFCESNYNKSEYAVRYIENDSIYTPNFELPPSKLFKYKMVNFEKQEKSLLLTIDSVLYRLNNNHFEEVDHVNGNISFFQNVGDKIYYVNGFDREDILLTDLKNADIKQYEGGQSKVVASIRNYKYLFPAKFQNPIIYPQPVLPNVAVFLNADSVNYNFAKGIQTNTALLDRENQIWVGSEEGLYRLYDDAFTAYSSKYLPRIWAILEDSKMNFWFGSFTEGIYKLKDGKLTKYSNDEHKDFAHPYFHPSMDKRGRLFFPNTNGLLMVDGILFEQKKDDYYMTTYYDEASDLLWVGSRGKAFAFDKDRKKVHSIGEQQELNVGTNVLTIGKDIQGFYWLGGGTKVAKYDLKSGKIRNYSLNGQSSGCYTQRTDYKGRTWFGSRGGLFWYNSEKDTILQLKKEELSSDVVSLETIDSTWLVVSQPFGIYLMNLQKYYRTGETELHLFNEKNGFTGVEPNQDGMYLDSHKNLWITTSTELMHLNPQKLKTGLSSPFVRIDKCNGNLVPFNARSVTLKPNQNSAIIKFEAICFNRPNPVKYSWKLNTDTNWTPWQEEDYAVLSSLRDGQTTLQVRAQVDGLPQSAPSTTELNLQVQIAIYRQPWFFPAIFSLISLVGIIVLLLSIFRMKKASREARVFQIQAIQSQMNPHFIFNVLASLQAMILKANISRANDYLVKLADLIRGFLESAAGTGTIQSPKSADGMVTIASELALLKTFIEFQQLIHPHKFEYKILIDDSIQTDHELIPPLLIQPFIENAIRHGLLPSEHSGWLVLSFQKRERQLMIQIEDNGIGIRKAREMAKSSPLQYISRGSDLTINRIKLLNQLGFNIEYAVNSSDEQTIVKIILNR